MTGALRLYGLLFLALTVFANSTYPQDKDPFDGTVLQAEHLEPAIPRPEQETVAAAKLAELESRTNTKPNVLIFIVDDMGWGDPGVYGGGTAIGAPTPSIDRLAREGLLLTSTYAQSLCTPTRAAMMTGRIPARSGLSRPILSGENPTVNPWASENTAAKLLSANGYRTALSGKWHLGEGDGYFPSQVGYDEFMAIMSVSSDFSQVLDPFHYPELIYNKERHELMKKIVHPELHKGVKGEAPYVERTLETIEQMAEIDQAFADYSEDFIRRAAGEGKPFYLIHSFSKVHNDNYPAAGYAGRSPAATPYKDSIVEVDDITGRLVSLLGELGIEENTFVFFTSDNGANEDVWPDSGHHPFRGGKGTTWEGGVRVPGIAYWKGMISGGRTSDGLFDLTDLFNTTLALGGAVEDIPSTNYIDGIDQTSFLLTDDGRSKRQVVYMYGETTMTALRWEEYKIHFRVYQTPTARLNIDESTLVSTGTSPWVYNLYLDPKEQISTGHRYFEFGLPRALYFAKKHAATYSKYPMKDIGLGVPGR
ncbi:MAG: arylsulfatase [Pseudomonadota bacterium]